MKYILLSLALLLLVTPAQAGKLFPPDGAADGTACPNNQVLAWTGGGLQCQDPTSGVVVPICPAGHVLSGIINGVRNCVSVSANVTVPSCPDGQVIKQVQGGQPVCVQQDTNMSCADGKVMTGIYNNAPVCKDAEQRKGCSDLYIYRDMKHGEVFLKGSRDGRLTYLCADGKIYMIERKKPSGSGK